MDIFRPGIIRWIAILLLGGYAAYLIWDIADHPGDTLWDLRTYYLAAKVSSEGENPYDQHVLAAESSGSVTFPFVYPPVVLVLLRPLLAVDVLTASRIWLALQCLVLLATGLIWRRYFLGKEADLLFWVFCFVAFNSPLYIGLISGNIVLIEQLLIWAAFAAFLRGRYGLFSVLLCAASVFKLAPIVLVVALLLSDAPRRVRYFASTLTAFAAIQILSYLISPASFRGFVASAQSLSEWGLGNPSTYAVVLELFRTCFGARAPLIPAIIPSIVYLAIVAAGIAITYRALAAIARSTYSDRRLVVVFILLVASIVLLPRAKNYSYAIVLPATYWIMKRRLSVDVFGLFFVVFAILTFTLPGVKEVTSVLWTYFPLLIAWAVLGLYATWVQKTISGSGVPGGAAT